MNKIVLFLFVFIKLFSFDDFDYDINLSSKSVVIKEGIIVSVTLKQKKIDEVLHFDFSFNNSPKYSIKLLESDENKDINGRVVIKSKYLLYPLQSGEIFIEPKLIIQRSSQEELKKFVTGSADELDYLQTNNQTINLKPIKISVKDIADDILLVGDYKLTYNIDKRDIDPNEQINIKYILSGYGYRPNIETFIKKLPNVDIFLDREFFDRKEFHKYSYLYALKAEKSFTISEFVINAYNPKTKKRYQIKTPKIDIKIKSNNITNQYRTSDDKVDIERYINYILIFIGGFFAQKLLARVLKNRKEKNSFIQLVKKSKNSRDLLKILIIEDNIKYKDEIELLEKMIYQKQDYKLSKIKSSIIKKILIVQQDLI